MFISYPDLISLLTNGIQSTTWLQGHDVQAADLLGMWRIENAMAKERKQEKEVEAESAEREVLL